jgi:hypothetical protein
VPNVLHLHDSDTGESSMDVVSVPEGFSLQLFGQHEDDYRSIILSPESAHELADFIKEKSLA